MRIITCTLLVISLMPFFGCGKSDKTGGKADKPKGIERFIIAKSGLRMRDKPDVSGNKLATIPYGKSVELLEETGEVISISGTSGRWAKIRWSEKTGWVFGGFLGSSVTDRAGKTLPAGLIGTYLLNEKIEPGNMPSRIHLENSVITKAVGGDVDSSEYCVVSDVKVKGKAYTISCAPRKLTDEEQRIFQVDKSAADLKKLVVTDNGSGNITVGRERYSKRKG